MLESTCASGEAAGRDGAPSGPGRAWRLKGFTLRFEALVPMLACEMPFAAVAQLVGESWQPVASVCGPSVEAINRRTH